VTVRLLPDEHIEPLVGERLAAFGYDVDVVKEARDLGEGSTDTTVATVSTQDERVIITSDSDCLTDHDRNEFHALIYFENNSLKPTQVADIVDRIANAYSDSESIGIEFGSAN